MNQYQPLFLGDTQLKRSERNVTGEYVDLLGESFYKIQNYDAIPPFFMSLVSSSDHWLFISSTGGLTAGRRNVEQALFPYYTEDKLTENSENTGSKTILLVRRDSQTWLWEPFSIRGQGQYQTQRNLYKNIPGTALVFEEVNHSLGLTFRYAWRTSDCFGFVKTSWLANTGSTCDVELLDGIQNILPANAPSHVQNTLSCLLDAYKRSELDPETGLAIYALNSTLTDLPEPSESLLASTVFQVGLDSATYLLSAAQLDRFRNGQGSAPETEIRGSRGAFFVCASLAGLPSGAESVWHVVADVSQDSADIVKMNNILRSRRASLGQEVESDIVLNTSRLQKIVASADGLQTSANSLGTAHHFANVMFNVMRGGVFADGYWVDKADFTDYVTTHNRELIGHHTDFFTALPEKIRISELHAQADATRSADLIRLARTYLPLTFSRRHGDPSRPWNRFAINIKKADGSQRLDYEGNWRDIFQNWEALAYSYPEYVESMIFSFLSATTVDGYNPYRITRSGIDWEIPEPGNPWANIGYWSDHQIIYLLKLMELSVRVHPGKLRADLDRPILSYANVPYRIRPYIELLRDPYNTIHFDRDLETEIDTRVERLGTDGKLVCASDGRVLHSPMLEKLLTLLLAKLVNFVPEGGIWMNTQRPEWNDANNALVGKGLSVVTLGYLRRYIAFCQELFGQELPANMQISAEVNGLFTQVAVVLEKFQHLLAGSFNDEQRRAMMDALGQAGNNYREAFYSHGFSGELSPVGSGELLTFLELARRYIEHSLRANRRDDNLYHAYNILHLEEKRASIGHLYEMLEGQVSILSSGMLTGDESLTLLESLRHSTLYRTDQHTYILYPDKTLPGFLSRNSLTADQMRGLLLPAALSTKGNKNLLVQDENGVYHFSGGLRNGKDIHQALDVLGRQPEYAELVAAEREQIIALFDAVFRHTEFTGRSGTFFAYEGLGSIYWHMVSKLLLAVQETIIRCQGEPAVLALLDKYRDIRAGLGFNKSPAAYGAFPTDPYSHTPKGQGARQPGMTGMVKEEILTRQAELGMTIENGCLVFNSLLLERAEVSSIPATFTYVSMADGDKQSINLPTGSVAFTLCQAPIVLQVGEHAEIRVDFMDGSSHIISGYQLDETNSRHIFQRDGAIQHLTVTIVL
jgi:hypothetical protein